METGCSQWWSVTGQESTATDWIWGIHLNKRKQQLFFFFFFLWWVLDTETVVKKCCWITILCNIQNLMAYSPGRPALGDLQRSLQTSALLCYGCLGRSWTYINWDHNYIFKWRQLIFKYLPRILINSTAAKLLHRKLNVFTKSELNSNIDNF